MSKIKIIYGSNTGITEAAAKEIAKHLDAEVQDVAHAEAKDFQADILILGTSTWGFGELQDDWHTKISLLDDVDLYGKKVAIFGLGDQEGYADTFLDGVGILYDKVCERGATVIGKTSVAGYYFSASTAVRDGEFCGLALDETMQAHHTQERIRVWTEEIKKQIK